MAALARGGTLPVLTSSLIGIAVLLVAIFVNPIGHIVTFIGVLFFMLSAFLANFFRDPNRLIPKDISAIVSPADGHVMFLVRERAIGRRPNKAEQESDKIELDQHTGDWYVEPCDEPLNFRTEQRWEEVPEGQESENDVWRIAIFMSPLDVHVNRVPETSEILSVEHRAGKGRRRGPFVAAYRKESEANERVRTVFKTESEIHIEVTQIAGALARTIIPWKGIGDKCRRGERFGMIRLGSRVDVRIVADNFQPCVTGANSGDKEFPKGEFVQAGSTILFKQNLEEE